MRGPLLGAHRRWLLLALDALLVWLSLYAAYLLRFEGSIPDDYRAQFWEFLPLVLTVRVALHFLLGIHHWSFRLAGLPEAMRLVLVGMAGSAGFVAVPYFLRIVTPPRSVVVLEFFLTTSLVSAVRFSSRVTQPWLLAQMRSRSNDALLRTIIVGAGSTGELLLRDLKRSPNHPYEVVGFVDDNPAKLRASIGGRPVLGNLQALPDLCRRMAIQQ